MSINEVMTWVGQSWILLTGAVAVVGVLISFIKQLKEIKAAMLKPMTDIQNKLDSLDSKQEIDDLIHKNRNFAKSKNLFDEAAKANKTDDLVEIIESLYCNRKTTSAMLEQLEMNIDEVRSILEL